MGRKSRSKRERREEPRLRRVAGTGTIFCDEAGFTGNNLLDKEQEVFAFASVALPPDAAGEVVERTLKDFKLSFSELKGSRLLRSENGRKAISAVIQHCARHTRLTTHLKKFALACKFFEYIYEPALSDQNSIFYGTGFHLYVSTLIFLYFRASDATAEALFDDFATLMRQGDPTALQRLFPAEGLVVDYTTNPLQAVSLFAMLNHRAILQELDAVRGDGSEPNWVLDLTTTSLFCHLSHWAERFESLDVSCDQSKPLEADTPFLNCMVNRTDHVRLRMFGKEREYTFNLVRPVELVDSKQHPGIQLADVMASTTARVFQSRYREQLSETERGWMDSLRQCFLDDNIWPDFEHIDLRRELPFVNSTLLLELADRCLKKQDLFDGIPEIIGAAHAVFPRYYREEVARRRI